MSPGRANLGEPRDNRGAAASGPVIRPLEALSDPGGSIEVLVPENDAIIGVAFRISLLVLLLLAGIAGAIWWLARPDPAPPPPPAAPLLRPARPEAPPDLPQIPFTDITGSAGLEFVHTSGAYGEKLLPETMGPGCAFLDVDDDGDQDLLLVNGCAWPGQEEAGPPPTLALYANEGRGRFTDVTRAWGLDRTLYGMGVATGDVDGDGDTDLYLTAVGENLLLVNDGDRFHDGTARAGVAGAPSAWSTGAVLADLDRDGDLDLFVCNYIEWSREIDLAVDFRLDGIGRAYGPPMNFRGTHSSFFENQGDGTFREVGAQRGIHVRHQAYADQDVPVGKALAVVPLDANGDGWTDLFVANDTVRNFLFVNRGAEAPGSFEETGELAGVAYDMRGAATGAMGADLAHHHNDPRRALLIGNFAQEMSSLYVGESDGGLFTDQAASEGIGGPSRLRLTFGAFFLDADLDGHLDVLQCNGHLEEEIHKVQASQEYRQPAQLFWNCAAQGRFVPLPDEAVGDLAAPRVGRGAAYADIDGDGDLDVLLTQCGKRAVLLRNDQTTGHHWLRVRLRNTPGRSAHGATVRLIRGGEIQYRTVNPSRSYLSSVETTLTFGLGPDPTVDDLVITWPDGAEQHVPVKAVDRLLQVRR